MMAKSNAHPAEHSQNTGNAPESPLRTNSWVPAITENTHNILHSLKKTKARKRNPKFLGGKTSRHFL